MGAKHGPDCTAHGQVPRRNPAHPQRRGLSSGPTKLPVTHPADERIPLGRSEKEHWSLSILRIANDDLGAEKRHFDATVRPTARALLPHSPGHIDHPNIPFLNRCRASPSMTTAKMGSLATRPETNSFGPMSRGRLVAIHRITYTSPNTGVSTPAQQPDIRVEISSHCSLHGRQVADGRGSSGPSRLEGHRLAPSRRRAAVRDRKPLR
jgi:hypothetical protein